MGAAPVPQGPYQMFLVTLTEVGPLVTAAIEDSQQSLSAGKAERFDISESGGRHASLPGERPPVLVRA